jgi:hypothetical protein
MIPAVRLRDPAVRRSIEDEIERLIALLDYVEPDPDFEPWLAGGIEVVGTGDREGDDEREPNGDEGDYSGTEDDTVGCGGYVGPSKGVLGIPDGADIAKKMLREHARHKPTGEGF